MPTQPQRILASLVSLIFVLGGVGLADSATAAAAGSPTAAGATPQRKIVQLGDSYSAGNGAGDYLEKICLRSPNNYGAQVARALRATYTNVACSGGVLADLTKPRNLGAPRYHWATYSAASPTAWLKQARSKQLCGKPAQSDWRYVTTMGKGWSMGHGRYRGQAVCQLQARPQIEAISASTTDVFLTIGGNDAKFSQIAANCLVLRNPSTCRSSLEFATAELDRLRTGAVPVMKQIRQRSGGRARVYLLGYPNLIDRDSYRIPEIAPSYDAGAGLAKLQAKGNQVQRAITTAAGAGQRADAFTFINVTAAWRGRAHGLDPRVIPNNRSTWIIPPFSPGRIQDEWVHPTRLGWDASAVALSAALH